MQRLFKLHSHRSLISKICFIIFIIHLFLPDTLFPQMLSWQILSPPISPNDILIDNEQNIYVACGSGNYIWFSTDKGKTWTKRDGYTLDKIEIDSTGFLWGGNSNGIFKSTDMGITWSKCSDLPLYSLTVSRNNWIWTGSSNGRIVYSSDSGISWTEISVTTGRTCYISSNNQNHIFAGDNSGKIYRTTDLGLTWEQVYNSITASWISGIVIDDSNYIYANHDSKILISKDNGSSWEEKPVPALYLFMNKFHNFFVSGYRSLDDCSTWTLIGPPHPIVKEYAFIDSMIFAISDAIYLHFPSYIPTIGNYFPLSPGNKWQFVQRCNTGFYENFLLWVDRDSLIGDKKYYLLQGYINDWVRYDNDVSKLFIRWNNIDYVAMDFTLDNVFHEFMLFNDHHITSGHVNKTTMNIFDSSYNTMTNWWYDGRANTYYYSEELGLTSKTDSYKYPGGPGSLDCDNYIIRAVINNSTGLAYYSDKAKPQINLIPVTGTGDFLLNWNFSVNHPHSNIPTNFIDSVIMYSYYSNGDSSIYNESFLAENTPNTIDFKILYLLDSALMKDDYAFHYKIYAVDKGIVPEHSTVPDTGYIKLIYDPNLSTEQYNNKITDYILEQNYPNPFNPVTFINYTVKEEGHVELVIYDILGKVVDKIIDENKSPGRHSAHYNASLLPSGIYFYRIRVNEFVDTKKMILLK